MNIEFKTTNKLLGHSRKDEVARDVHLHYHDGYELYYLISGTRNYLTENNVYPLSENWVTLTRPYIIHGTSGQGYERLLIYFSDSFLSDYFQPALIELFHEVFSVDAISAQVIEQTPRIKELFYLISDEFERDENRKIIALHLGELLLLLYNATKQSPSNGNSTLPLPMQNIIAYISNNITKIKTLEQVANHFYLSKYYLSHQFKKYTGFTFIEFLTKAKISRALSLLEHTNDSIINISEACGFETPTYFGVVFKKKMHMTPQQYRTWIKTKNNSSTKSSKE